jgi:glycosyltransferase involved in cell wall biosynthesis
MAASLGRKLSMHSLEVVEMAMEQLAGDTGAGARLEISVVIPTIDAVEHLPRLLRAIELQTAPPCEVIIIDSSSDSATETLVAESRVSFPVVYRRVGFAYPGHARNLGVRLARSPWIAFLDSRTVPYGDWLAEGSALAAREGAEFVEGLLECHADTRFKKTLLAATYGSSAVRSLPGSLVQKRVFEASGGFLERVRAGEDIEWMGRLRASGARMSSMEIPVASYEGFPASLGLAVGKWHAYTVSNARIDVLNSQKIIYSTLCFLICFLFVYRWNDLFAHWKESSIYYVPNITKMFLGSLAGSYLIHRGLLRPLRRKVRLCFLLPWRWIEVFFVGFCLDLAKTPGMVLGASILIRKRLKCHSKGGVENET